MYILLIILFLWTWLCNKVEARKDFRFYYFLLYCVYQNFQNGFFRISLFTIQTAEVSAILTETCSQSCQVFERAKNKLCDALSLFKKLVIFENFFFQIWSCITVVKGDFEFSWNFLSLIFKRITNNSIADFIL